MNHHFFSKYTLILCRDCGFSSSILKQRVAGSKINRHMKSIILFIYMGQLRRCILFAIALDWLVVDSAY